MTLAICHLLAVTRSHLLRYISVVVLALAFGSGLALAASDAQGEFEQALKESFPGSYMLYASLSGDAQGRVFKEYKRNGKDPGIARFSKVISKILELAIEEERRPPSKADHQQQS